MCGSLLDRSSSVTKTARIYIQQVLTCHIHYVVNSLRQLVETLDPSPEYTYRHLFYEVVVIIDFGIWKVYGQSFSKSRHIFSTITDFCMSYALFPYNFNILFQKSQMSFSILFWIFSSI